MSKTLFSTLLVLIICVLFLSACQKNSISDDATSHVTSINSTSLDITNGSSLSVEDTHIHLFDEWETTKTATCTSDGTQERYCSCGEKQTRNLAKLDHNFGNWVITKEATCKSGGAEERVCACGQTEKRSTNTIAHKDENGLCSMCKKTMNPYNALKHYVISNGSKLSSGAYLFTDKTYTDSLGGTTYIEYNETDDEITIGILIELSNDMWILTTNVIDRNSKKQKIQMQYQEDERLHYCSAYITTSFCESNNSMTDFIYRGEAPSYLKDQMYTLLNDSSLIMLTAVNVTLRNLNFDISLSDFGYINYT